MSQLLQNVRLKAIMEKENCETTEGIENVLNLINKCTPLGPFTLTGFLENGIHV